MIKVPSKHRSLCSLTLAATTLLSSVGITHAQNTTPHIDAVTQTLENLAPGSQGSVWERTTGNQIVENGALDSSWLLQSPNCWGETDCSNATGAQALADAIYRDISNATQWIDITTLITYPDGIFQKAIVDGIKNARRNYPNVTIRILGGTPPGMGNFASSATESAAAYLKRLENDLGSYANNANLVVAGVETSWLYSWNHSKIIAVDAKTAIVGGHNLWEGAYGNVANPISDVTMRLSGPAAESSHKFADQLWDFACTWGDSWWNSTFYVDVERGDGVSWWSCPSTHPSLLIEETGSATVLALGGLGFGMEVPGGTSGGLAPANDNEAACSGLFNDYINNDSEYSVANLEEEGLRALVASAQNNVYLSQQDLIAPCAPPFANSYYDARLFDILAEKLINNIPVRIMVSAPGAKQSLLAPYSNMKKMTEISDILVRKVKNQNNTTQAHAEDIVCNALQLAPIRITAGIDTWSNGNGIANHAKVISVDDAAFYIGSKNLYPAALQDFGFIVEDAEAAAIFTAEYKEKSWNEARSAASVDFEAGICNL